MADRDPDEIAGFKPLQPRSGISERAAKAHAEQKAFDERPEPTADELAAFAKGACDHPTEYELPVKPMPADPAAVAIPPEILAQMQEMAQLQKLQNQTMLAMKDQLDQEKAERVKLEAALVAQEQKINDGQVHYKMPSDLSEDQVWNLMVNDPRGVLG